MCGSWVSPEQGESRILPILVLRDELWLEKIGFVDIQRQTTGIEKPLAKSEESDISRVPGDAFWTGSAVEAVVVGGSFAIVHADEGGFVMSAIFVCWGMCAVCPAKREC